ncbi:MAG: IS110 family transposase [Ktedonobacteraceae bacterium]
MQITYHRCCGIDVHKKMIVACLLLTTAQGVQKEIQTFSTMVSDLFRLRDWLTAHQCEVVAMESTGVYWKCIWNVLEGEMELLLCNAQHIKAVPGRKTDVKDAEWIADLLQHGLLQASFVPPRPQRELRDLTRYRSSLAADRTRLVNRIQKTLEDTNIKLASVATDIMGKSGRAILEALLAGEQNPQQLAELAQGRMKGKREQLVEALQGTLTEHHHFLLTSQLRQVDFLASQVQELDQEIAHRLGLQNDSNEQHEPADSLPAKEETLSPPEAPVPADIAPTPPRSLSHAEAIRILDEVPGINVRVGSIVVAELGLEMERFPDEAHLASWVGLCPAANISANKRLSSKIGKGNRWLRQALIEVAHAAARSKGTFLEAYYQRLRKRMGHKKAIVALAHRILVIIYHLLKEQQPYRELGPDVAEEKAREASKVRAVRRLEQMGYHVTLQTDEVA